MSETAETDKLQRWTPLYDGALTIRTADEYVAVANRRQQIKDYAARITHWFRGDAAKPGPLKRAYDSYLQLLEREKDLLRPANAELPVLDAALVAYDTEQERLRKLEEQRLAEQARREEEDQRLREAAALELAAARDPGLREDAEAAAAAAFEPVVAPAPIVPKATPKVAGVTPTYRDNWKARPEVDVKRLAAGVASGKYPPSYLLPNMVALNQKAASCEGRDRVDGVVFWNDRYPVGSRRK